MQAHDETAEQQVPQRQSGGVRRDLAPVRISATEQPKVVGSTNVLALQRTVGNRAVGRLLSVQARGGADPEQREDAVPGRQATDDQHIAAPVDPAAGGTGDGGARGRSATTPAAIAPPPLSEAPKVATSSAAGPTPVTPTRTPPAGGLGDAAPALLAAAPVTAAQPYPVGFPGVPGASWLPPGTLTAMMTELGGPANATRDVLELTRPIPGLGMLTGAVSDGIGLYTDLQNFKGVDAPFSEAVSVGRDS